METGSSESGLGFKTGVAKTTLHTKAQCPTQTQVQILFYLKGFLLRVQRVGCLGVTIPTCGEVLIRVSALLKGFKRHGDGQMMTTAEG